MAFKNSNLSVVAYANGFTLWHYTTTVDDLKTIKNDYFPQEITNLMNCGDIMIINASDTTAILPIILLRPLTFGKLEQI